MSSDKYSTTTSVIRIVALFGLFVGGVVANDTDVSKPLEAEIYLNALMRNYERRLYLIETRHEKDIRRLEMKMLEADNKKGSTENNQLSGEVNRGGATYIRWGRESCSSGAELVYKGYAASSHYTHTGGGANHLCLTERPKWEYTQKEFEAIQHKSTSYIYGSEYQFHHPWPFKGDNVQGGSLIQHDVPCAACAAVGRTYVLMIPGTFQCPDGWREEYHGYLAADYHSYQKSEFVCVDGHPEAVSGGHTDVNGALFYYTQARCGALPCPPYVNEREVTCVVCSRK